MQLLVALFNCNDVRRILLLSSELLLLFISRKEAFRCRTIPGVILSIIVLEYKYIHTAT